MPRPTIRPYHPREIPGKDWGIETVVAELPFGIMKVMVMRAGAGGNLQHHEAKHEAFHLLEGRVHVDYVDEDDNLIRVEMTREQTFLIPPGAIHRVTAIEDSLMVELSNPVYDDRVPHDPSLYTTKVD